MEQSDAEGTTYEGENTSSTGTDSTIPKVTVKFNGSNWHNQGSDGHSSTMTKNESSVPDENVIQSRKQSLEDSADDGDGDFEPSVDSMIHEFDDESTLEHDEDYESDGAIELAGLTKESEMPLDELYALYYGKSADGSSDTEKQLPSSSNGIGNYYDSKAGNGNDFGSNSSENGNENDGDDIPRALRSKSNQQSTSPTDSVENSEINSNKSYEDWKKLPRVGSEFQVGDDEIPEVKQQSPDYDTNRDILAWDPTIVKPQAVEYFLTQVSNVHSENNNETVASLSGSHLRDNEDALFVLKDCDNNIDEAIRRFKWRTPPLSTEQIWSEMECQQFEAGLSLYGKDFHAIHHNKVKTKSIGEIVKFYYVWKKTERYDNFNAKTRLGKKNNALHPGITDYMERLLDETEQSFLPQCNNMPNYQSHSVVLQQHMDELRNQSQPDVNGCLDNDFVDDVDVFDINPTIPPVNCTGTSMYDQEDPILVGYSDPNNFASVSSTINVNTLKPCANYNNIAGKQADTLYNNNANSRLSPSSKQQPHISSVKADQNSFRPVEPAQITPPSTQPSSEAVDRLSHPDFNQKPEEALLRSLTSQAANAVSSSSHINPSSALDRTTITAHHNLHSSIPNNVPSSFNKRQFPTSSLNLADGGHCSYGSNSINS